MRANEEALFTQPRGRNLTWEGTIGFCMCECHIVGAMYAWQPWTVHGDLHSAVITWYHGSCSCSNLGQVNWTMLALYRQWIWLREDHGQGRWIERWRPHNGRQWILLLVYRPWIWLRENCDRGHDVEDNEFKHDPHFNGAQQVQWRIHDLQRALGPWHLQQGLLKVWASKLMPAVEVPCEI